MRHPSASLGTEKEGGLTSAVFGNTNENHVIWNRSLPLLSGRRYFQSDPTDTRKNQRLSPHSHSPTM